MMSQNQKAVRFASSEDLTMGGAISITSVTEMRLHRSSSDKTSILSKTSCRNHGITQTAPKITKEVAIRCSESKETQSDKMPPRRRSSRRNVKGTIQKVHLDHPEIIRAKAKSLLAELEKRNMFLSDESIERLVLGDPREYLSVMKRIFSSHRAIFQAYLNLKTGRSLGEILEKLEGKKMREAVSLLFSILTQALDYKPPLSAIQFMQSRFTIQKLILCNEVIRRLNKPNELHRIHPVSLL